MVHKAAAVRALRVAECTRRVRAAHHTVRARAVCIRVTTRAPPQCSQHTQASTASRRAGHAIRPRRAPTRASGAERTATAHARRLASRPGPADVAPGLAAAAMSARAARRAPVNSTPRGYKNDYVPFLSPLVHPLKSSPSGRALACSPRHRLSEWHAGLLRRRCRSRGAVAGVVSEP